MSGASNISQNNKKNNDFSFPNFFRHFGPGLLISIAYLDPGNCIFLLRNLIFMSSKSIWRFRGRKNSRISFAMVVDAINYNWIFFSNLSNKYRIYDKFNYN